MAAAAKVRKAPFPYFGGKQYLVPDLLALLPPHEVYVDVFGGSGALLFAKSPAKLEVYNDLDSGLVNFFRVLRSPADAQELRRLLDLTPYSREEWSYCLQTWQSVGSEPVEQARRWFVALVQSFSKTPSLAGWSYCKQPNGHAVSKYRGLVADIPACVRRFSRVQVEQRDFTEIVALYDAPNVLFYCDPPYLPSTRKAHGYRHEMTQRDHELLLDAITTCAGMVVLSGYRSDLYDERLTEWQRIDRATVNWSSNVTRERRVECIWVKPNSTRQLSLFAEAQ